MKKYLFLISAVCILLCSCSQQSDSNIISNEIPEEYNSEKDSEANYSKLHELALMYEKYAWGYSLEEYTPVSYVTGLLVDLNKQDKFLDETTITIPYEVTKEISSLFMSYELIDKDSYNVTYSYPIEKYPNISLEPFQISNTDDQINVLYGRFVKNNDGSKHWLYPVKYTAVPYVLTEDNIPSILSDVIKAGEQMYRIINVENIYDIDIVKNIYIDNGYGELFEEKSYELTSSEDVVEMSKRVNSCLYNEICATYNLMNDIDMSSVEFIPIGRDYNYMEFFDHRMPNIVGFCGVFNGNNHSISNLSVLLELEKSDNMEENSIGFFSVLGQGAVVKDLNILNANIGYIGEKGSVEAGILAGRIYGSKVENCIVSGTVKGTVNVGGLSGDAQSGYKLTGEEQKCEITDCHADIEVYGGNWIGGFVGSNAADIINCSVKGIVTCDEIINNKGHFTGDMPFGIGGFTGHNSTQIRNCGANVWVKTMVNVRWVGSFIGYNDEDVYECFYNSTVSNWKPVGYCPNDFNQNDITDLPKEEYYTRLSEIE